MVAADTNFLVRLIAQDDPAQTRKAMQFIQGGVWAAHLVVVEAISVLRCSYGANRAEQIRAVEMLIGTALVTLEDAAVVKAALALFVGHAKLGFTDCLVLEIARKAGHTPLGTFDKALGKLPGAKAL